MTVSPFFIIEKNTGSRGNNLLMTLQLHTYLTESRESMRCFMLVNTKYTEKLANGLFSLNLFKFGQIGKWRLTGNQDS